MSCSNILISWSKNTLDILNTFSEIYDSNSLSIGDNASILESDTSGCGYSTKLLISSYFYTFQKTSNTLVNNLFRNTYLREPTSTIIYTIVEYMFVDNGAKCTLNSLFPQH